MAKVICIDNLGEERKLTLNKIYLCNSILLMNYELLFITDNNGCNNYYSAKRFISLDEYREKRLKLILNE